MTEAMLFPINKRFYLFNVPFMHNRTKLWKVSSLIAKSDFQISKKIAYCMTESLTFQKQASF